ncbi:MAG TPA: efflux transporter outer membrane subunit, partial [Desulfobaccales bacterium]|nr:efflux transporter outer membrane subunit [Desulfobaccales bacterium]
MGFMSSDSIFRGGSSLVCLALILGMLTAGCVMVGPDYERPPVKVEKTWMETANRKVQPEITNYKDWWQVFNDPTLTRLIDTAYRENLTLRIAGVRVLEAQAQLGVAVGEFYPQVQQGFGDLTRTRLSERGSQSVLADQFTFNEAQVGLLASWELDFWGKFRRNIQSANASLQATIADYDNVLVSLTASVANSYIAIRTLEKRLRIAHQNVKTQTESLQIAEARFKGGTTSQRDVEQAKTILANTEASIPTLETQLRQAQNALCVLLGMPPRKLADLLKGPQEIPAPPPSVAVGIPADLLRRRPDIRRAELQAVAQCSRIGVAKADLYPSFYLNGTVGFAASDVANFYLGDLFEWRSRTASFGPSFQWNLFNYGRITNQVRVQDARFQEALIAFQNSVLRAQQEVEDNLVAFLKSQKRAKFLSDSTAAALRSVNLALIQYREGITDFTTVLTAQQSLLSEQDSLASTLGNISQDLVGVYRSLGGGWQIREGKGFVPQ